MIALVDKAEIAVRSVYRCSFGRTCEALHRHPGCSRIEGLLRLALPLGMPRAFAPASGRDCLVAGPREMEPTKQRWKLVSPGSFFWKFALMRKSSAPASEQGEGGTSD